ncbi:hypothetical protein BGZ90_012378, partial [Linnemannia elongata]
MTYAILNSTMPTIPQTSRSRPAMGARRLNNENVASGPSQPITYVKDVLSAVQSRPRQTAPGAIQATRKRVLGEKPIVLVSSSSNTNNSNNNIHPSASDKENGGSGGSKASRPPSKKQPLQTHGIPMVPVRTSVAVPSSVSSASSTSNHTSVASSSNTTTYVPAPGAVRKPLQERIPVANQQDKITFQQQEKPHVIVKKEPGTGSKSSLQNVMRNLEYNQSRPVKSEPDYVKPERTVAKRPAEDSLLHG